MGTFLELAHDRYSVRKFADKPVEDEKLEKIIEAGVIAPTATNAQPFKIFLFKGDVLARLNEIHTLGFAKNAPAIFIVGSDPRCAWVRPFDGMNFADVDASIVATQMMLEIHDLGLGSTWCGYFDQDKVKEAFPELAAYNLIALFPVGYIAEDSVPAAKHEIYKPDDEIIKIF